MRALKYMIDDLKPILVLTLWFNTYPFGILENHKHERYTCTCCK